MRLLCLSVICLIATAALAAAADKGFTSLDKVMDPATYQRAGLQKLSKDERQVLDDFLKDYISAKQKTAAEVAAAAAIDRAVKERKVQPPQVIESRIVGPFNGYGPRTFFHLENGQVWRPSNGEVARYTTTQNPAVVIYKDFFGYKMFIENASTVRVTRVQ